MTDRLSVPSARSLWVFRADLSEADQGRVRDAGFDPATLAGAVGAGALDPAGLEIFDAATFKDYGLARYLTEANGMDAADVTPDAQQLNVLTGPVLLVFSSALPEGTARLSPSAPLDLIGRYSARQGVTVAAPLHSDAAHGVIGDASRPASEAAGKPRNIAALALLALVLAVGVSIWVGLR
jgi:hypothetical protein